jgi:hypothetical protein
MIISSVNQCIREQEGVDWAVSGTVWARDFFDPFSVQYLLTTGLFYLAVDPI